MHNSKVIYAFLLLGLMLTSNFGQSKLARPDDLLEIGRGSKMITPSSNPKDLTVVSYNIRWRTSKELDQIIEWLENKKVALVALQEVDRARERTGKTNNARVLAEKLGMFYAWAAPPPATDVGEEETGVELLSAYPLSDVTRIVLPHAGPGGRFRVAIGATVKIGKTSLRVYSVHSETRIPVAQKIDQLRAVLDDLGRSPKAMPAIVMGDFNSWEPATMAGVRELFTNDGWTTPFSDESTFKRDVVLFDVELKLDWIWLRGLSAQSHGIDRAISVSDHFPLWTVVRLPSVSEAR